MRKLLFVHLCAAILYSCSNDLNGIVISRWSILFNQAEDIATLPSEGWKEVDLPIMFQLPYPPKRDFQYVWFKGEFDVTDEPSRYYGIIPGRIYFTDSFYLNGALIGEYVPDQISNIHYTRAYRIPKGLLQKGKNTVFIRVGLYGKEYGGIRGRIEILPRREFVRKAMIHEFVFRQLPIGVGVFLFGQMVFHLLFFFWRPQEKANLYCALLCAMWILYIFSIFTPCTPVGPEIRIMFLWSSIAIVPILFIMLIQAFYKVYLPHVNRIVIPSLCAIAALMYAVPDTTSPYYLGKKLGVITLFMVTPFLAWLIWRVNRIKPRKTVFVFVFFGVFPGLFIGWDVINYLWIFHEPPILHTYTLPIFIIGIMILIIADVIERDMKLEILYRELSRPKEGRKTVITVGTEEKLERVIEFLKQNYTSDISREGLAAAIGMSGDHMSRMFKAYTGKKINDFINELRVEAAAERLCTTNEKIIDIAFSVGFESLATFNRAFVKIKGVSPSNFRKEKNRS
ncbi:MAG: AraC family transcriptional regulator [Spirochaetes bacterium]|nr:AraC family transcriptional regulator [Spirochaetota bacterium]